MKPPERAAALVEAHHQLGLVALRAQAAEEQLLEAARHKDAFLAMVGHELRNPLACIRNAAEVLKQIGSDDDRVASAHAVLDRQVGHITRLVDDLLDISLMSRGAMKLHLEPVDLNAVIRRALQSVGPLIERKGHGLRCDLAPEPTWVEGDTIRLGQVFENLLNNAGKYTPNGGLISIASSIVDGSVVVRLRDNGLGFAPGLRSQIFELFMQDARAADRSEGGLGIGLALVRHLVTLHGGTIEATSPGFDLGSEFVVRLPLLQEVQMPPAQAVRSSGRVAGRVMIVDDDVDGGASMAMVLELYGHEVRRATDLASAMALAQAFAPQVVLMDISMPGADGYEVARRLRTLPGIGDAVVYIAVTGFAQAADFQRSREAGFAHHLCKPVDPNELDQLLRKVLSSRPDPVCS